MTISPENSYSRRLVVMVKEPRPGRVKTRLGKDVGMTRAAWWFRHQTERLLREVTDPRWQTILSVSPDRMGLESRIWPSNLSRIPQGRGGLGTRMARIFTTLPPGPVAIIGGDIPGITSALIDTVFMGLGSHDAVLGPASDGGYWAIGLKRSRPSPISLFKDVRWSTKYALSDTLGTMPGLNISLTATLDDVDNAHDLSHLSARQRYSL